MKKIIYLILSHTLYNNIRMFNECIYRTSFVHTVASEESPLLVRKPSSSSSFVENIDNDTAIYQASVFIEDGVQYRSIHHKIDLR